MTTWDVPVIYHDDHVLIVDKPSGLLSIPDGYRPELPHLRSVLEPQWGPVWPVYPLDKETSGVLPLARDKETRKALRRLFERGEMERVFHVLVRGNPEWETYVARHPLRTNVGRRKRTVVDPQRGQPAETHFRVLERLGRYALVEARPITDRRHQIRVHLYVLGHPVVGEPLYGPGRLEEDPMKRLAVHARRVVFPHPRTGETVRVTAEHPEDFTRALESLRMEMAWVDTEVEEE